DFSFISQDSSSYMYDLGCKDGLLQLVSEVEKIDGVKSARILYLYPSTLSLELIEKIINSKVFHNYFDMPIQHISDAMLKRMKRGAGAKKIKEQLNAMKNAPKSFLRTSIIVGHPCESEEEFEEVCEFLNEFDFDRVSIFAYSDEEGTSAYKMSEKIDEQTIDKRIEKLNAIVEEKTKKSLEKNINQCIKVILEGESSEGEFFLSGRKLDWTPEIDGEILINDSEVEKPKFGQTYDVLVRQLAGDKLVGEIVG
ncbi:MAG: radical SAM protein, partial [Campylobacteraceae bacterium]|nr:radical SAM protein [Campylobacteraceae bacterium]